MWNINKLTKLVLQNDQSIIKWCQQRGLIKCDEHCPKCYAKMKLYLKEFQFKCCLDGHIMKLSINNTWFSKSKLQMDTILLIT